MLIIHVPHYVLTEVLTSLSNLLPKWHCTCLRMECETFLPDHVLKISLSSHISDADASLIFG